MIIKFSCHHCHQYNEFSPQQRELLCLHCNKKTGEIKNVADVFDYCPACNCRQFYMTKDFNQFLGCFVMLAGIVLVPFTYGLSLPFFAFIDWLFYRRVPSVIVCYRCGCEFLGFDDALKRFKPFLHHIGLKYDKYR